MVEGSFRGRSRKERGRQRQESREHRTTPLVGGYLRKLPLVLSLTSIDSRMSPGLLQQIGARTDKLAQILARWRPKQADWHKSFHQSVPEPSSTPCTIASFCKPICLGHLLRGTSSRKHIAKSSLNRVFRSERLHGLVLEVVRQLGLGEHPGAVLVGLEVA